MASTPGSEAALSFGARKSKLGRTSVQYIERRAEREANEVVARRVEKIPPMRGVDVKEDTRNHYGLLLQ
jgi:hypothetical protein